MSDLFATKSAQGLQEDISSLIASGERWIDLIDSEAWCLSMFEYLAGEHRSIDYAEDQKGIGMSNCGAYVIHVSLAMPVLSAIFNPKYYIRSYKNQYMN